MIGNYLTTTGRAAEEDWQMLKDLNLSVTSCC
jgi:biotin synthase